MSRLKLAALALLALAGQAQACSCVRMAPEGFRAQADVILYGRVVSATRAPDGGAVRAKVRVLHPVKGKTAKVITVQTGPHSAACGIDLTPGTGAEYLLMKRGKDYATNLCLMLGSRGGR